MIAELQEAVKNKTGGPATTNIYVQNDEPGTKDGLWLKTNKEVNKIIEDDSVFGSEEWNTDKMSELKSMPISYPSGLIKVNTDVYLFLNSSIYKYNILNDNYTQLESASFSIPTAAVVNVGTDIYFVSYKTGYKYDTLTSTFTSMASYPSSGFSNGKFASVGTNIYFFGGDAGTSSTYTNAYKYDTLTDTYTQITSLPTNMNKGSAVAINTDIYLFGSTGSGSTAYKYNTLTNTYSSIASLPGGLSYTHFSVAANTDIYLFGNSGAKTAYKYDTLTNTYTKLNNCIYENRGTPSSSRAIFTGNEIYIFACDTSGTKVQVLTLQPNTYQDKSIVIANNKANRYETKLLLTDIENGLKYHFNNFWYATTENDVTTFDTTTPKYYGNGTEWVQIGGTVNE